MTFPKDLTPYFHRKDLINETAQQIIKDFELVGIKFIFKYNTQPPFEELVQQMLPHISRLLENKKLNRLLYRVDVSEGQLLRLMENNKTNLTEAITLLIIKRELQKVVIRNYYKKES